MKSVMLSIKPMWRWKQVAVCEEKEPLKAMIPAGQEKEYRIISNGEVNG